MHDRSRALGPTPAGASASRTGAAGTVTGVSPRPTRSGGCNSTAADRTVGVATGARVRPVRGGGTCGVPGAGVRASCPPRGGLRPHESVGGLGRRETLPGGREGPLPSGLGTGLAIPAAGPAWPRPTALAPPASASMPRVPGTPG
ncbi:MAG: hypothetical protein JO116_22705, partial [Planctomycetaceae bacterium]|nr:hypothetical protein [Planctomycetaceae bacterium]